MNAQKGDRLKLMLLDVPPGFLVDSRWFSARDISRSSVHDYARRGWLERVAHGVYRRPLPSGSAPQDIEDWQILVLSLQRIMQYHVHVGGATALGLQGYTHYLRLGAEAPVFLYGDDLPGWTDRVSTSAKLILRSRRLFKDVTLGLDGLHGEGDDARPTPAPWWKWPLVRSTPERAILEALNELPDTESFHMLDMAFESLTTLRPRKLTALFASCASVKVKRLFLPPRYPAWVVERSDGGLILMAERC
jgi:Transcriptional regulator, AbiEi antitoxin N-terminal domain/Transcriptional regulator, AbiEi antitoxin, Type IV TA system